MSRFENKPIPIPQEVQCTFSPQLASIKGPKGQLQIPIPIGVEILQKNQPNTIQVHKQSPSVNSSFIGLAYRLLQNAITGVRDGYSKNLEINGVGYRWTINANSLKLQVGFSHEVVYNIPNDVSCSITKNLLKISGISKEKVGLVAAQIRAVKPVEVYKAKGIKYLNETIIRKVGKKGA